MNESIGSKNRSLKLAFIGLLPLAFALSAHAQDSGRIDQLETEIRAIKLRLSKIEATQGGLGAEQKPMAASEGWKSISSWRQLKTGMSPEQVRAILGEPNRIEGGGVAHWYYFNGGVSTFMQDKLYRWTEPNQ